MISGELLTRGTIWISVVAYTIGCIIFGTTRHLPRVRLAWTIGCAALLAHFAVAFHFYHAWSLARWNSMFERVSNPFVADIRLHTTGLWLFRKLGTIRQKLEVVLPFPTLI